MARTQFWYIFVTFAHCHEDYTLWMAESTRLTDLAVLDDVSLYFPWAWFISERPGLVYLKFKFYQIRWNTIGVIHQTMSTNIGHLYFICSRPYLGCPRTVQSYYPMELWDDRRRWLNTSTAIWVWPMMYFNQVFFNLESCFVFCALLYGAFASTRSWEASSYPLRPCVRFPGPPRPNCWIIDSSLVYLLQDTRSSTWFGPCGPPLVDDCFLDRGGIGFFCANGTTVPSFWKKRLGIAWNRLVCGTTWFFFISFNVLVPKKNKLYSSFAIRLRPLHCCSWCLASDGSHERRLFVLF